MTWKFLIEAAPSVTRFSGETRLEMEAKELSQGYNNVLSSVFFNFHSKLQVFFFLLSLYTMRETKPTHIRLFGREKHLWMPSN
jgi:hypothetical protein